MTDPNLITAVCAVVGSVGGAGYWLIRLEGKANNAASKYAEVLARFDKLESKVDALKDQLLATYLRDS